MDENFIQAVARRQKEINSLLCVGLDPTEEGIFRGHSRTTAALGMGDSRVRAKIHRRELERRLTDFCTGIISATADSAAVFKPNIAFFSDLGAEEILKEAIRECHLRGVPVILDSKRGDIGNTAQAYAREAYVRYGADAVTVNPYMGDDTIEPFLKHEGRGVVVLCRTSNPGSGNLQDQMLASGLRVYEHVAIQMAELNAKWGGNRITLVMGATFPEQLARVREFVGDDIPLLIPGIGAQGGDIEATVRAGRTKDGSGMMINSSRGIIFAPDPVAAAIATRDSINQHRFN